MSLVLTRLAQTRESAKRGGGEFCCPVVTASSSTAVDMRLDALRPGQIGSRPSNEECSPALLAAWPLNVILIWIFKVGEAKDKTEIVVLFTLPLGLAQ